MNINPEKLRIDEMRTSQVPALQMLIKLGYQYIPPAEAVELRGGRTSEVILEPILIEQLRNLNRIDFKGREYPFAEGNILSAVQALKDVMYDGLVRTNEKIYELLTLGKSLPQSIDGDTKHFSLQYIDWEKPDNNVFHCTAEYEVERTGVTDRRFPDIVLFVNGIPFGVIECKSPSIKTKDGQPVDQAVSQQIRNQHDDEIPGLFIYSQLLLSVAQNGAKYGTTGTPAKFWAVWHDDHGKTGEDQLEKIVNQSLSQPESDALFMRPFNETRKFFDEQQSSGTRLVTEQDRAIYCLFRPERLLDLTHRFIVFDAGIKKIARYQQYLCVNKIMRRVLDRLPEGNRKGGVVWHTQGSGKSLTMVMLAKALALDDQITNPRVVLVTDRVDLDDQIWRTFSHCGKEPVQASTGQHLIDLLKDGKSDIIATVIDKFDAGVAKDEEPVTDDNIFVLVDESHRTQYKARHAKMRLLLPQACYIGFTGTPVAKKEKNTIQRFGGLIDTYTITQAVKDKAVVPLLYEGRHVEQHVSKNEIDSWFEKMTIGLSDRQKADLKRKFANTDQLNKAVQRVARIAWDVSVHYQSGWKGTGFKGQLVAPDKATALLYKKYLDEFALVESEVLISGPDDREGETDIDERNKSDVVEFWKKMMKRLGTEREYNRELIKQFSSAEGFDIIIVVSKLLTGFDCPPNTILYLTRPLKEHTLLQAIARVNRLHDGKEFGYIIDYRGVLKELDFALDLYGDLDEFDRSDLDEILTDVSEEISKLPQRHSDLWDVFKEVRNRTDIEAMQLHLQDDERRSLFYDRFSGFSRALGIAMSSEKFLQSTPAKDIERYRVDLKYFKNLRYAVGQRFAETVNFGEYQDKIAKLVNTYVGAGEVEQVVEPVNIFDTERFEAEVNKITEPAAKADTIAHRTLKTISERWQEDPAFYEKFSKLLEEAIEAFRKGWIDAAEYLTRVQGYKESVKNRTGDDLPDDLQGKEVAKALYGVIHRVIGSYDENGFDSSATSVIAALKINDILEDLRITNWGTNTDRQNQMRTAMEDSLFELKEDKGFDLSFEDIDKIMDDCIGVFKARRP